MNSFKNLTCAIALTAIVCSCSNEIAPFIDGAGGTSKLKQ